MGPSRRPRRNGPGRVGSSPGDVVGVREHLFHKAAHVGVVGHVVDPGAVPAGSDETGQPELGQMLRNPGRLGANQGGQLVDGVLPIEEGPDDPQAGLIPEQFEHPHGGLELVLGRKLVHLVHLVHLIHLIHRLCVLYPRYLLYLRSHVDRLPTWEAQRAAGMHRGSDLRFVALYWL
jgi:hypothetical protein